MQYIFSQSCLVFEVDRTVYNDTTVHKCLYWYTGHYIVNIYVDDINWRITLTSNSESFTKETADRISAKLSRDLIDFKLRDIVNRETATVRELIIAKAFAHEDVEEAVPGTISDPVGFQPEFIIPKTNDNLS